MLPFQGLVISKYTLAILYVMKSPQNQPLHCYFRVTIEMLNQHCFYPGPNVFVALKGRYTLAQGGSPVDVAASLIFFSHGRVP